MVFVAIVNMFVSVCLLLVWSFVIVFPFFGGGGSGLNSHECITTKCVWTLCFVWMFICVIVIMQYWWLMHWLWQKTGALQIGHHKGPIQPGDVYSGGQWNIHWQMKRCFFNNSLLTKNVFRGKKEHKDEKQRNKWTPIQAIASIRRGNQAAFQPSFQTTSYRFSDNCCRFWIGQRLKSPIFVWEPLILPQRHGVFLPCVVQLVFWISLT